MKKAFLIIMLLIFGAGSAFADNFGISKKDRPAESKKADKSAPSAQTSHDEIKKKIEEKKKELNGSEWEVDVTSGGKSIGKDTFTFQNSQVTCKTLSEKGYPATNYTVSIPDGGEMGTWETMQTSSKGAVMFIRAEWKEGVMRGVMSEQIEGGSKDYNFASVSKTEVPPTTEKKKEEEPAKTQEQAAAETAPDVAPFNPGTTEEKKK